MNDKTMYADVDLPFHVWVREGVPGCGFRWVLREATELDPGTRARAITAEPKNRRSGIVKRA